MQIHVILVPFQMPRQVFFFEALPVAIAPLTRCKTEHNRYIINRVELHLDINGEVKFQITIPKKLQPEVVSSD